MHLPEAVPGRTRIGWIGTGVMGASMCGHLIGAGFAATLFNRTRAKAEPLLARGARWADSPRRSPSSRTWCSRWSATRPTCGAWSSALRGFWPARGRA